MAGRRTRRGWGTIRRRASGRYQAYYTGPDLAKHYAPHTFDARVDAEMWLSDEHRRMSAGTWTPPSCEKEEIGPALFGTYAAAWLEGRDLKPRTREHYADLLDRHLLPRWADAPLAAITPEAVRTWHVNAAPARPATRTHAYSLLRTILGTAVTDGHLAANPCHIRGAGTGRRVHKIRPATLDELDVITEHLPERYRAMLLLAVWCQLRFGELTELRRQDIELGAGVIRVRRAVVRAHGQVIVGTPKSDAGVRDITMPPHIRPGVAAHLDRMASKRRDALVFPAADGSSHMAPSSLYRVYYPARDAAGRPDLRWHDLRHTGAVLSAQAGATLADLMNRMGHSTSAAAMIYQHAAAGRDAEIASRMSTLAEQRT